LWVSNAAVCTSGDYERRGAPGGHHILDPRTGSSATELASVTVVAPTAVAADAVATAAFVLGPAAGLRLCERLGVDALMLTPAGERYETRGMGSGQYRSDRPVSANAEGSDDDRAGGVRGPRRAARGG
jgi:thiamine biosynthesis lipoprotein